jgi:hypothetical protein
MEDEENEDALSEASDSSDEGDLEDASADFLRSLEIEASPSSPQHCPIPSHLLAGNSNSCIAQASEWYALSACIRPASFWFQVFPDPQDFRNHVTTAADVRNGRDPQNIAWDRLQVSRDKYRVCPQLPLIY